jgi:glycosyltransferase involved in cell wall biosynthesis
MKILILTQYYPPETGAPQNRLHELALRIVTNGVEVHVLTAMPNYPKMEIMEGYRDKSYVSENLEGITVHRTGIYVSKSRSIANRLRNYFSFVWSSATTGLKKIDEKYDYVMCESPPLFLALSAFRICRRTRARLIFNVSDLWPESAEKLGIVRNKFFLWLAYKLEALAYRRAFLVTGQTQGICADISQRFPDVQTYWLPNGVDLNMYNPGSVEYVGFRNAQGITTEQFIVFYGGIIGHAQGLEILIDAAEKLVSQPEIVFVLLGEGPEKEGLEKLILRKKLSNILLLPGVPKQRMKSIISEIDVSVIPLKKLKLFEGAIPSKIFEILSMEKPILLGVDGEARKLFIDDGNAGLYYTPENVSELVEGVLRLYQNREECRQLGVNGRIYVKRMFNRDTIAANFLARIRQRSDLNSD